MRNTTKRTYIIFLLILFFLAGLGYMVFSFVSYGDQWSVHRANSHLFSGSQLTSAGSVYDRNGAVLAQSVDGKRIYNESESVRRATLHLLGDTSGYIATGVQTLYRSSLVGYSFMDGVYDAVNGKVPDLRLTVDSRVCADAYEAMDGDKGTVLVYNYLTGEVICMVSAPTYDPENKPESLEGDRYEGVYINRALTGVFTPGSTFKTVTAIAAIENIPDIYERRFTCEGRYTTGSGEGHGDVICNGTHGTLSFERALNVSCNCVFAQLAIELGPEIMTQTVRDLGFSKKINVSKATTVRSSFDLTDCTPLDLGWAGIGQYTTLINPMQMLLLMGAIANSGTAITPYIVEEDSLLGATDSVPCDNIELSSETADKIAAMLRSNVKDYYSDKKFPDLEMCGKTGSAEVAGEKSHAWFVGFSQRKDLPYAIVVCLENGGIGYNDAIPVANEVMQSVLEMKK